MLLQAQSATCGIQLPPVHVHLQEFQFVSEALAINPSVAVEIPFPEQVFPFIVHEVGETAGQEPGGEGLERMVTAHDHPVLEQEFPQLSVP